MAETWDFPSLDWMHAYARTVQAHPASESLRSSLAGRYRFVVEADRTLPETHTYDLVVTDGPDGGVVAEEPAGQETVLTIRAANRRWRKLLTGKGDLVVYYLTRRISVDGDVMALRDRLRDARPLLSCLKDVPTRFA